MKRLITGEVVDEVYAAGARSIRAPAASVVVTPGAWSRARELGVAIDTSEEARGAATTSSSLPRKRRDELGRVERRVDASGIVVVPGGSVELGRFAGAGEGKDVALVDVIGSEQRAPMTAGFMSWRREDSFSWTLGYDEIDLVLEGVLHVVVDGRTVEARAGDVVYIPKGSRIVFATPSRVRVFYVTHPADWQKP